MDRNNYPFDKMFSEFDAYQFGGLTFQDFINMNEFVGVSMAKKHLKIVYNKLNQDGSDTIDIEEVRRISLLKMAPEVDDVNQNNISDNIMAENVEDLKGNDILARHQVIEIYEDVKSKLEQKSYTLEQIFFSSMQTEEGKITLFY